MFFYNESFEELTSSSKVNNNYFFYCLPKGSLIYQDGSYKPIEEVIENKTDLGNGNICIKKHVRDTENEELLKFNIMGVSRHYDLRVSKEHILFVYDSKTKNIIEKKAKDITLNDNLVIVHDERVNNYIPMYKKYSNNTIKTLNIDYSKKDELALLLGMFMAEGHRQNGIIFSYHVKETYYHVLTKNLIKEIFGLDSQIREKCPHDSVTQVMCFSNELERYFLKLYNGKTARYKKLNNFVMHWDKNMQLNLLKGWLYGDGGLWEDKSISTNVKFSRGGRRNKYKINGTTSSFDLAIQMYNIALRCGLHPCFKKRITKYKKPLSDGRIESISYDVYFTMKKDIEKILSINISGRNCGRRFRINEDKYLITRINKIEKELYSGKMYDLTTTHGNFWTFGNVKVHNCDPPYLITTANYNENGGWDDNMEHLLYKELDKINSKGAKFALSNVIEHKGKSNDILKEWMKKYNVHYLNHSYSNCSYQGKNTDKPTIEVLITNY